MIKNKNLISGLLGLILSIIFLYLISSFPQSTNNSVGPDFFPRILAYGLGIFSLLLVTSTWTSEVVENFEVFTFKNLGIRRAFFSLIVTVIYCLLMETFGFIACTIIYLCILMFMLKERNYLLMIVSSCLISSVIFIIFNVFLNITLPLGLIYGF